MRTEHHWVARHPARCRWTRPRRRLRLAAHSVGSPAPRGTGTPGEPGHQGNRDTGLPEGECGARVERSAGRAERGVGRAEWRETGSARRAGGGVGGVGVLPNGVGFPSAGAPRRGAVSGARGGSPTRTGRAHARSHPSAARPGPLMPSAPLSGLAVCHPPLIQCLSTTRCPSMMQRRSLRVCVL